MDDKQIEELNKNLKDVGTFDKEHEKFRQMVFMQFMGRVKQKYMGLVR